MRSTWLWFGLLGVLWVAPACDDDDDGGGGSASTTSGTGGGGTGGGGTGGNVGGNGTGGTGGGSGGVGGSGGDGGGLSIETTPCDTPPCDLTVTGTGFGELNGKTAYVGLQRQGQAGLEFDDSAVIASGTFTVTGQGVIQKNMPYFLNYFVDLNDNQGCDITPTDAVWRLDLSAVQGHLEVVVPYNEQFANLGCSGFP